MDYASNLLSSQLVLEIKNAGSSNNKYKAGQVVHGNFDREKVIILQDSTTLKHFSLQIITNVSCIFEYDIWIRSNYQAYTQSDELLR